MKKLRPREGKWLVGGHRAGEGRAGRGTWSRWCLLSTAHNSRLHSWGQVAGDAATLALCPAAPASPEQGLLSVDSASWGLYQFPYFQADEWLEAGPGGICRSPWRG